MKNNGQNFRKNDAAFTGLEAAIVLIAFVVVAAVFSYVMLGAGFFTSQKSKEGVHTGVDQATSSIELNGDIIGVGSATNLTGLKITLALTEDNNPVDISKLVVSYRTSSIYNATIFDPAQSAQYTWIQQVGNNNNLLEQFEKVQLNLNLDADEQVGPNTRITLEIKPATGTTLSVSATTPPSVDPIMTLV